MKAIFENIQGFKGYFEMHLDANIINITSKFNGTGKTTFFECIKLLCLRNSLSEKEELEYILHKDCNECMFKVRKRDVAYAFYYNRKYLIYTYEETGYPIKKQDEPFQDVQKFLGVMLKDDVFINVCDRFINLFSSSNEHINYDLINAIISHKKSNEFLETLTHSLEINKSDLKLLESELVSKEREIERLTKYTRIDDYERMLSNETIIVLHDKLSDILDLINRYVITRKIIDISFLTNMYSLYVKTLNYRNIIELRIEFIYSSLTILNKLRNVCNKYYVIKELPSLYLDKIGKLMLYMDEYDYMIYPKNLECNIKPLKYLINISSRLIEYNVYVNKNSLLPLSYLKDLSLLLNKYINNETYICSIEEQKKINMKDIQPYRGKCKYNEEVYIIEGRCYSV